MKKILILTFAFLTFVSVNAQLLTESFDPTGFPPTGWTNNAVVGGATDVWSRITITTNLLPPQASPHSGAGMAQYDAFNFASGNSADLSSPVLNMTVGGPYKVSFWMYRDNRYTDNNDSIEVYINNTAATSAGGTKLGGVWRHFADPPAQSVRGWYQYSFNIPPSFNTATNYIIFKAISDYGTEMILDDVLVVTQPTCQEPSTITPAPVNTTSITLNWPTAGGATGYEYVLNTLSADPTGAGTAIGTNSVTITGTYTLGNTYYAHVRTACAGSTFSIWKTIAVIIPPTCTTNTLPVNMATGLSNPINLSWVASTGATSYNVFLSSDNGATYTNLGNIAGTTAVLSLVSSGTFYWYVQPSNGGVASGCQSSATSFTTLPTPTNDLCAGATVIPCGGSVSGNNGFATNDALPTITCGSITASVGNNKGVWFTVTPTLSGPLTVSVCTGTAFDTYMRVYDGACGAFTTCLGFNDDGCGSQSSVTFTSVAGTTYYILLGGFNNAAFGAYTISATCPALCNTPTAVAVSAITLTTASVAWTGAGTNIVEYGLSGFTPGTGATAGAGGTVINPATSPQAISGLASATAYQVYVRQDCTGAGNGYSTNSTVVAFTTLSPPPANDEATGAIALTIGAVCTGAPYTIVSATASANEVFPSCSGVKQTPVWFKFVAPPSGTVRVTNDFAGGTFTDSKVAIFTATNPADYTTFSIVSCDDDGGSVVGSGFLSVVYAAGLIPGNTYYVAVDKYGSFTAAGTFCITADEINTTMLATANTCASIYQTPVSNSVTNYTGALPLMDANSKLIALVRQPLGVDGSTYSVSQNINTGAVRTTGGVPYLNRNFRISSTQTNVEVQFFFLLSEVAALTAVDPTVNLSNLGGSKQTETVPGCQNDFVQSNGVYTGFNQIGNTTTNGVGFITINAPSFSNFYLHKQGAVLPISIVSFKGKKQGTSNYLDWKVSCTSEPSLTLTLERSADGRNFKTINDQNATATRCLQGFDYSDASPLSGANYYRLKVTSTAGKIYYSTIVVLLNKEKGFELISVAPNPTKNVAILTLTSVKAGNMNIVVTDVAGKVVAKQTVNVIAGNNPIDMNFATLGAGTYTIAVTSAEGEVKTTRFVKY